MCKYILASFCCVAIIPIVLASGNAKPYTVSKPLKALIDDIFVNDMRWTQWPPKRAALEAFGILRVISFYFGELFAGKSLITELRPRKIEPLERTVAFVIADGGNSVDGILTALFLWFHGVQVVGFQIRNSTESNLEEKRALDNVKLASEIVMVISSEAGVTCSTDANSVLLDVMNKHVFSVFEGENINDKIERHEKYYTELGDAVYGVLYDIVVFKVDGTNNIDVIGRMGGAINDLLLEKMLSEKSEFYAENVVASLKGVMRALEIEIIEEGSHQWEESRKDHSKLDVFQNYKNIVLALDALNGPSTQYFCIYKRFYLGLDILKRLKEGLNGNPGKQVKILGVDMPSFYESLALKEQLNKLLPAEVRQRLSDDVSRVVPSDLMVLVSYVQMNTVPISGVPCHLVVPEPVQAVLDKNAMESDKKPPVQPIRNWLTFDVSTKSEPIPSMEGIIKNPNALLSYCHCLRGRGTYETN